MTCHILIILVKHKCRIVDRVDLHNKLHFGSEGLGAMPSYLTTVRCAPKLALACAVLLLVQRDREFKECNNWATSIRVVIRINMRFNIDCMKSVFEKKEVSVPFPYSLFVSLELSKR